MNKKRGAGLPWKAMVAGALVVMLLGIGMAQANVVSIQTWGEGQQIQAVAPSNRTESVVSIETWNEGQQTLVVSSTYHLTATGFLSTTASVGGERDIYLEWLAGTTGAIYTYVDYGGTSDRFSYTAGDGMMGRVTLQWDGNDDDPINIDSDGLDGVDLTGGGTNDGIWMAILFADLRSDLRLEVYEDTTDLNWSYAVVYLPALSPGSRMDIFFPFSTFVTGGGTGAVFTDVGAVVMTLFGNLEQGTDVSIDFCEANRVREYGDLPGYYGNSILDAGHIPAGMRLGYNVDAEVSNAASALANGDDNQQSDDEDGVTRRLPLSWAPGTNGGRVYVTVRGCRNPEDDVNPGPPCYVSGWIDWERDGDFSGAYEQILDDWEFTGDATNLSSGYFAIPAGTPFTDVRYYARFRICQAENTCDEVGSTQDDVTNGEIEDYAWDWGTPTAVEITSFAAAPAGPAVLVAWETASEIDNAGFYLYRRQLGTEPYVQLHEGLIASLAPGSPQGHSYSFLDADVQAGLTYQYLLEDVDFSGVRTANGPVQATAPYAVFLPLVRR